MKCNTASVLKELFEHSKETLPADTMRILANLGDLAETESNNLAQQLQVLAIMFNSVDKVLLPSSDTTASILFGLAERADAISAMVYICTEAEYLTEKQAKAQETQKNQA